MPITTDTIRATFCVAAIMTIAHRLGQLETPVNHQNAQLESPRRGRWVVNSPAGRRCDHLNTAAVVEQIYRTGREHVLTPDEVGLRQAPGPIR
jgi:hypothetical protein